MVGRAAPSDAQETGFASLGLPCLAPEDCAGLVGGLRPAIVQLILPWGSSTQI
ncbi:hypothetical protein NHX12_009673, partial [Muraenolepis orangiensis]